MVKMSVEEFAEKHRQPGWCISNQCLRRTIEKIYVGIKNNNM